MKLRLPFPIVRKKGDGWLIVAIFALAIFGILMVYDSSVAIAMRDFGDQYHYAKDQLRWLGIASLAFIIASFVPYKLWHKWALPMLVGTLLFLIAVFLPGIGVRAYGAHRWLNLGVFILQPAEVAKFALIVYLSAWFSVKEKGRLLAFLILLAMVGGLVLLEPDLGTTIIIVAISLILYFLSGGLLRHFLFLIPIAIAAAVMLAVISPYRASRITTFLHPETDPLGSSYQIRQVLLGLGSGGMFGLGIGQSRQKYEYLPEANTDSIFAIIGEEVGFVGAVSVIGLYVFLIWRIFRVAKRTSDSFGKLLASGVGVWIGIQSIINFGAMVALLPLTGVPLPLISYGGSGLVIMMTALGVVTNISKQVRE